MDSNYLQETFVDPVSIYNGFNDYGLASPPQPPMEVERKLQQIITPQPMPQIERMTAAPTTQTPVEKNYIQFAMQLYLIVIFITIIVTALVTSSITAIVVLQLTRNSVRE